MSDYIKREDAIEALNRHKKTFSYGEDNSKERYAYMQHLADFKAIENIPTADVVEVVRCKDCKYWQDQEEGIVEVPICTRSELISIRGKDDYCSYGERADA